MKRFNGFSLMEMMVVLLIVSVVAAASAPMINKKLLQEASEKSPWVRTRGMSIAYNLNAASNQTASIGAPEALRYFGKMPKLYITGNNENDGPLLYLNAGGNVQEPVLAIRKDGINTDGNLAAGQVLPLVAFDTYQSSGNRTRWLLQTCFDWFGNGHGISLSTSDRGPTDSSVVIGDRASATNHSTVVIGRDATATGMRAVAIGRGTSAQHTDVVIGYFAKAESSDGFGQRIAIGSSVGVNGDTQNEVLCEAKGSSSTAIGTSARALPHYSIAIGRNALASSNKEEGKEDDGNEYYSMAIGALAKALRGHSVAIGPQSETRGLCSIALGNHVPYVGSTVAKADYSVAIGPCSKTQENAKHSVAIGHLADAMHERSVAIGPYAKAMHKNSVAIGPNAKTTADNQIVLGGLYNTYPTVYIPGNLVVDGNVYLGRNTSSKVFQRMKDTDGSHRDSTYGTSLIWIRNDSNEDIRASESWQFIDDPSTISLSDRRLKNVGKVFTGGLEEIKKLEVFNYTFKKDEEKTPRVGVMAQDLQKIFPNAVFKGDDGFLRIRMEDMFYALVNAVKELDKKIEEFKNQEFIAVKKRIDVLEKENKELKEQNKAFEKRLAELEKKLK